MGEEEDQLIPGLPADLATLCLAKLPIDAVARSRAVSRAWASTLRNYPQSGRLPQGLAVYCKGKEDDNSMTWLFLSRSNLHSLVIPFFFFKGAQNEGYTSRLEVIATGTPLLLVLAGVRLGDDPCMRGGSDCREIVEDVQGPASLQGFDVWRMKWLDLQRETPWNRPMPVNRWQFATAYFGKHVYFAGGDGLAAAATSAQRLSLDTWTWETLPPMHKERSRHPSGFAIAGLFFVVGGESHMVSGTLPQSGEFYDPATNAWTLVPDMWPQELWWAFGGAQKVAIINDVAYAIDHKLQAVLQFNMDNPSVVNMKWQMVGQLPWSELDEPSIPWMHHLVSVQNELWAVLNDRYDHWVVFACKPHLANQGLRWERLPFIIAPSAQLTLTSGLGITT